MKHVIGRRDFFKTTLTAGCALAGAGWLSPTGAWAIEPIKRAGAGRLKVSLVGYSLRKYFNDKDPARKITLFDFIDYCSTQGFGAAEMTGYYFTRPVTDEYLNQLKRHAYLRGVAFSGTSLGSNFAQPRGPKLTEQIDATKKWVDVAVKLGAPYVRVFAGKAKGMDLAENRKICIDSLQECADYAGTRGVFIGLENDGGITPDADGDLALVAGVKSEWFGLNLDLGNYHTKDPYDDLARCAPYAINVHCKSQLKAAGKEPVEPDFARLFKMLREVHYQGYVALEYEGTNDPYEAIPGWLAKVKANLG